MGMLLVPIFVGNIFKKASADPSVSEASAAVSAETIFIGLAIVAIAVAFCLRVSSSKNPSLQIDLPSKKQK